MPPAPGLVTGVAASLDVPPSSHLYGPVAVLSRCTGLDLLQTVSAHSGTELLSEPILGPVAAVAAVVQAGIRQNTGRKVTTELGAAPEEVRRPDLRCPVHQRFHVGRRLIHADEVSRNWSIIKAGSAGSSRLLLCLLESLISLPNSRSHLRTVSFYTLRIRSKPQHSRGGTIYVGVRLYTHR